MILPSDSDSLLTLSSLLGRAELAWERNRHNSQDRAQSHSKMPIQFLVFREQQRSTWFWLKFFIYLSIHNINIIYV